MLDGSFDVLILFSLWVDILLNLWIISREYKEGFKNRKHKDLSKDDIEYLEEASKYLKDTEGFR